MHVDRLIVDRRKGLSTTIHFVIPIHDFAIALDKGGQIDAFLYSRKTFDRVCHGKILVKLSSIGLPINLINWIAPTSPTRNSLSRSKVAALKFCL